MTDAAPADARFRRAQLGVVAVFFVHGLLFASWTAHIPHIKAHLNIDNGTLGFALLGMPVGSVTATALAAYLIPRTGSRVLVQVCLVGYCLSGPIVGLTGSVAGLFVALFVWGAFQGTLDIAMNTQAIAVERARRRPLMNGMHACWSIGAFAGAGIGTLGVVLGVSLSEQLLVIGIPALIGAGLLTTKMLLDSAQADDTHDAEPKQRRISAAMLLLAAIAFAAMLCEGAAADWSSLYLRESLGAGPGVAGLGYTAFAFAMVVVRLFGNRLLARYPAQRLLPALAGMSTVGFGVALLVGTVPVALVGFFLLGLGLGAVVPSAFSAAGRLPQIHPGVGVAGVSGLGWAGFVFGPPAIGQLAGLTSLPVALGVVPVLTAFITVACARVGALRVEADVPGGRATV
ncbi:MAG: hypothetical protein QOF92_2844 [Pseudonocardiales bacterium]|jgi:MFS family permease|nr:hypothetical protein [Pseudonocardiales bacterium]MDT4929977.1 hypothetical protein [Pseudonocardiales bacterium]